MSSEDQLAWFINTLYGIREFCERYIITLDKEFKAQSEASYRSDVEMIDEDDGEASEGSDGNSGGGGESGGDDSGGDSSGGENGSGGGQMSPKDGHSGKRSTGSSGGNISGRKQKLTKNEYFKRMRTEAV